MNIATASGRVLDYERFYYQNKVILEETKHCNLPRYTL